MKVRILFFGATAALVGTRDMVTSIGETDSAADILKQLANDHPTLKDRKLLFAVNEQYVAEETRLKDGDQLAIFTPVSGG